MPKSQFDTAVVLVDDPSCALPGAALMDLGGGKSTLSRLIGIANEISNCVVVASCNPAVAAKSESLGVAVASLSPVLLAHGTAVGSIVSFALGPNKPKLVCVLSLSAPFILEDDLHRAIAGTAYKGYSSVVGVTAVQFSVMKQLRKGRKGFFHEDSAVREVYALLGSPIVTQAEYLAATGNLISQKSGVLCLPQERALRIRNGWDYIAAQAYSGEIDKLPLRPSELRSK